MSSVALTLLTKPGCHLCDDARDVVGSVVEDLRTQTPAAEVSVTELSILDDPELLDRYSEDIPVVLLDGAMHVFWRVDPARLRAAVQAAATEH